MIPATAAEAVALGLSRYFTGKPCKHGHVAERAVQGACIACRAIYSKGYSRLLRQRPRYVSAKPCVRCGSMDRYGSGQCVECVRVASALRKARLTAEARALRAKWPTPPRVPRPIVSRKKKSRVRSAEQRERDREYERQRYSDPARAAEYRNRKATWGRAHKAQRAHWAARRRAAERQRTPAWADKDAIAAVYRECEAVTLSAGTAHEVDHYYPLNGKRVSGLHVAENLRVIPAAANRRKRAMHPDEMPLAA